VNGRDVLGVCAVSDINVGTFCDNLGCDHTFHYIRSVWSSTALVVKLLSHGSLRFLKKVQNLWKTTPRYQKTGLITNSLSRRAKSVKLSVFLLSSPAVHYDFTERS